MGQTLDNGIYLPSEGERNCYDGLAANWTTLDSVVGGYRAHVANENIHITSAERNKWDTGVTQAYVLRYANTSLTALGTVAFSALDNTDNVKIGDKVLDSEGKLFALTAVDTANSTATLSALLIDLSKDSDLSNYYTKPETDTLLSNKATDSDVVHKSSDETVSGIKTFSSSIRSTAYPNIRMYLIDDEWNVQPTTTKQTEIRFTDKNSVIVSYFSFQHRIDNEPFRTCWRQQKMDGTSGYFSVNFNNLGEFYPENYNSIKLGTSTKRWKDCQTYLVNGLTPSSLSMPSGTLTEQIDISSYFTNTGNEDTNSYTAPANGWIYLYVTACKTLTAYVQNSTDTIYSDYRERTTDGQIRIMLPIQKNNKFTSLWTTSTTVSLTRAAFIPCQGNV